METGKPIRFYICICIIWNIHALFRFAEVRNTLQGKLEERLPFFSFIFPDWFKRKFSKEYHNFQTNTKRLTTPFDVHATLADILSKYALTLLASNGLMCTLD